MGSGCLHGKSLGTALGGPCWPEGHGRDPQGAPSLSWNLHLQLGAFLSELMLPGDSSMKMYHVPFRHHLQVHQGRPGAQTVSARFQGGHLVQSPSESVMG